MPQTSRTLPSSRCSSRSRHRVEVENEMIRRREKESKHMETWGGQEEYYKRWEKNNAKHDEWTSPRYYDSNNKLVEKLKLKKEKEEKLIERRDKLRRILEEEDKSYSVEVTAMKNHYARSGPRDRSDDIPTELLQDINLGLKLEEEDRRRHEAEIGLYHKWRINNPILRDYERKYRTRDLKLSWLDQQIEKRMNKEKDEEECRRILREREEQMKRDKERDEQLKKELQEKNERLRADLERQIREMKLKQEEGDQLKKKEDEERYKQAKLRELEESFIENQRRQADRECALYNLKQHKLKLKEKLKAVQENLQEEQELIKSLKEMQLVEEIENEQKKTDVKNAMNEFMKIIREQQDLEQARQRHLGLVFDSEARAVFERQNEVWKEEEVSRKRLIKDVFDAIRTQIEEKIRRTQDEQNGLIREREEMVRKAEEYGRELEEVKRSEERRRSEWKKSLNEDVRIKNAKKKQHENLKMKQLDEELEKTKKEEDRLRGEIINLQKRQLPFRPSRSRILF